jgi:xylulokinase
MLDGMTALPGVGDARRIRLIGGTSRNPLFLKIKASVFGQPLSVVEEPEATALGAALLAGVAAGVYLSFDAAWRGIERREHEIAPEPEWVERYDQLRRSVFADIPARLKPTNQAIAKFSAG